MGLNLMVGCLAEAKEDDEEYYRDVLGIFSVLNQCLQENGLSTHQEPDDIDVFECEMWGYSGLHHLRRLAAYQALDKALYQPGGDSDDVIVDEYYAAVGNGDVSDLPYQHLMLHGDSEGFYLPQEFNRVLDPKEHSEQVGGAIGSSVALLKECRQLAEVLQLPLDMDHESDALWEVVDAPREGGALWQKYGKEAFSCLRLIRACETSLQNRAALAFC